VKLTEAQQKEIEKAVDELFLTLKAKILGRFFEGPKIFFEVVRGTSPLESIEGIFRYTYQMLNPGEEPDQKQIRALAAITGNYIEAERMKTKAKILADVNSAKTVEEVAASVKVSMDKATEYIDMLVNNEVRIIQAYAEKHSISKLGASLGIEDPTVAKLGVIDQHMCKNCKKLWHTEDNIKVPKVYKLSELQDGYMKDHKNPTPTIGPTHPRCRHVMTFVPPNFGFSAAGQIEFKGFGYDIFAAQRGVEKSEPVIPKASTWEVEDLFDIPVDEDHVHEP
jgi:predicted transcriptional regulator